MLRPELLPYPRRPVRILAIGRDRDEVHHAVARAGELVVADPVGGQARAKEAELLQDLVERHVLAGPLSVRDTFVPERGHGRCQAWPPAFSISSASGGPQVPAS